jgi:hypothetical protein
VLVKPTSMAKLIPVLNFQNVFGTAAIKHISVSQTFTLKTIRLNTEHEGTQNTGCNACDAIQSYAALLHKPRLTYEVMAELRVCECVCVAAVKTQSGAK